jgi:PAS domain S-box-containing protein
MSSPANSQIVSRFERVSQVGAVVVVFVGCVVLVGWGFDLELLKCMIPGMVTIKANTAIGFVLAGASLLLRPSIRNQLLGHIARIISLIVVLIGALTLAQYVFELNLGIDELVFKESAGALYTSHPNRMSPITAMNFLLIGSASVLLDRERRWVWVGSQVLILLALTVSGLTLVGYIYESQSLYRIDSLTPIALPTALTFFILCVGALCARPERGVMVIFVSESAGGALARRLLGAVIGVPLVLGWLRVVGQRAGFYGTEFGTALFATATVMILVALVLWNAWSLDRADAERRRVEEERDRFFTVTPDLLCIAGMDGFFKRINPAFEKTLGFRTDEILSRPFIDFVHPEDRARTLAEVEKLATGALTIGFENRYLCADGSYKWLMWSSYPDLTRGLLFAVARDMTEHKRTEEEIRKLNVDLGQRAEELQAVNKELEAFSYSVSHDLRAPLRHISGFAELMQRHADGLDEKSQRYLKLIIDAARKMGTLIDDLLAFSRIGRADLSTSSVNIGRLVEEVKHDLFLEMKDRNIVWEIESLPEVNGDPALLRQVFANLISNALKYTRSRELARINIGWSPQDHEAVIFVRDNGVGFDPQYSAKLFGVFQRLHNNSEFEGTGIGLANVRRIIHRHGGRTWAEGAIDQGATFYFSLPTEQPQNHAGGGM